MRGQTWLLGLEINPNEGGTIVVNAGATLELNHTAGTDVRRQFDGLPTISGSGVVDQTSAYDVLQDLSLNLARHQSAHPCQSRSVNYTLRFT
jgi:hypothetical protein